MTRLNARAPGRLVAGALFTLNLILISSLPHHHGTSEIPIKGFTSNNMQASNLSFKPSPLSFGGQRASPFRRPSTPNSPPSARGVTPASPSSRGGYTPIQSPSKLNQSYTVEEGESIYPKQSPIPQPNFTRELPPSPTKGAQAPGHTSPILSRSNGIVAVNTDAAGNLPPHQVREIREAFQVLDRDNDGLVNKDDVADVLMNLGRFFPLNFVRTILTICASGQDSSPSTLARFFPPGTGQTINFPNFLNTLSLLMSPMSSSQELLNALAAFDDDDNGQVDIAELRDALLHTLPEDGDVPLTEQQIDEVLSGFKGRRAFGDRSKAGTTKRGETFQYHEFVRSVVGGGEATGRQAGPTHA
ncbi:hypothetical protein N7495_004970 [Penicillium taxi]|uniref:uncharacterized protein n=1 Tax=Penicillium taxi TaxID=168475 RepID=UPI002545102A|nr:uncharacterized protein N7495_004970 [Penicillium taxi]KAJ5893279.1 hypothetical protein N7495_004970 [Penicillium taxi]